ncbi:VOC family protein [Paraburkholderia acidisoli]|uniref:VOC family protein n=1 Tax=Paraburkholderia acidisoli TaxID=2571748 RepID=A0A7Z2GKX7_9BURK|nr:VOC family protein [Paraburkholderia acidisoli]QGZ63691.1 VOC family protein [Paraburkholderia acidisoli]
MSDTSQRPTFGPAVYYRDPFAALEWLEKAFGFTRQFVVTTPDGKLGHSEMRFGDGYVMVCGGWPGTPATSPAALDGKNTQSVHVQLASGLDAHCERARAAGAKIVREPEDQFYGDRVYAAVDPEGHVWSFGETVRQVTREEAEQASGLKIDGWV